MEHQPQQTELSCTAQCAISIPNPPCCEYLQNSDNTKNEKILQKKRERDYMHREAFQHLLLLRMLTSKRECPGHLDRDSVWRRKKILKSDVLIKWLLPHQSQTVGHSQERV